MALNLSPVSFVLKIEGDITGEQYTGNFEIKRLLSHRDRINKDSIRRNLLGEKPESAGNDAVFRAEMLALCSVSIVEAPKFWKDANNGLDLYDDNVIITLYEKVNEIQSAEFKKIVAEGEEAKGALKKRPAKKEEPEV